MQLSPRTALYEFGVKKNDLYDPETNIRVACLYLVKLGYHKNKNKALIAYNVGYSVADTLSNYKEHPYIKRFKRALTIYS
jgi:soluble lytic murein transglycosylase-like protein